MIYLQTFAMTGWRSIMQNKRMDHTVHTIRLKWQIREIKTRLSQERKKAALNIVFMTRNGSGLQIIAQIFSNTIKGRSVVDIATKS